MEALARARLHAFIPTVTPEACTGRDRQSVKSAGLKSTPLLIPFSYTSTSYQIPQTVPFSRTRRLWQYSSAQHRRVERANAVSQEAEGHSGEETALGTSELKTQLLRAVANTGRGKRTTIELRQKILAMIEELESRNPTKDPIKSQLVSGRWSLLYTAATNEDKKTLAGTEEGPFLALIKPLAFGQVKSKGSTQVIDAEKGLVDNIAEFSVFGTPGSLTIGGSCKELPPLPGRGAVRLDVTFEKFTLKLGKLVNLSVPLSAVNPKGWVDTTFVDQDVRIGRGDKGSVFVTARKR